MLIKKRLLGEKSYHLKLGNDSKWHLDHLEIKVLLIFSTVVVSRSFFIFVVFRHAFLKIFSNLHTSNILDLY